MSLNKGSLDKAIQLLKVKQLDIENQGLGDNPYIKASSSSRRFDLYDSLWVYDFIAFRDATDYEVSLRHAVTAPRTVTFPDKDFTVADNADVDELKAQNLIGSANKKFMNTNFYGEETSGSFRYDVGEAKITNVHISTVNIVFNLGLATNKGTKKLYVDSARMLVTAADENSKIVKHEISGISADGSRNIIDNYTTGTTSPELRQNDFTVHDCSGYEKIIFELNTICTVVGALDFDAPQIQSYYDT